ncbi:hypothetical protein fugu_002337 [Takifugu bimaculatus]|uniref:Uncharacterized protein n=1 Tax=Takifugu bimaculatus TaxID=433685 RepID=A0A4Z2BPE1_9TELE|nr:hypothetical protein fugu_002337 [Takifugu bimaculatus]
MGWSGVCVRVCVHVCVSCNTFCSEAETNTGCDTTRLPLPQTCPRGFSTVQRAPSIGHQVSQQRCAGKIPLPQIRERLASEIILIRIYGILHLQESQSCVVGKRKKKSLIEDYSAPFRSSMCSLKARPDPTHLNAQRPRKA